MSLMQFTTYDVVKVAPTDSVDKAISLMEEREIHHLVVMDGKTLVGIVSDRDILLNTGWMLAIERVDPDDPTDVIGPTEVEQLMSSPVRTISPTATAAEVAQILVDEQIGALPVVRGKRLMGIVSQRDLLEQLLETAAGSQRVDRFLKQETRGLMRANVTCVGPDASMPAIVELFRRHRIRHVPVVSHRDKLRGIISDRDVRRAVGAGKIMAGRNGGGATAVATPPTSAGEICTTDLLTVEPVDLLQKALRLMLRHRVHSVPVVQGEHLVGMLTEADFLKAIHRESLLF